MATTHLQRSALAALASLSLTVAAQAQDSAVPATEVIEDIAAARPGAVTVAFENDYVRVLRFALAPGEALPPHQGGPRVVYALSDYVIDWSEGGQALGERSWNAGEVHVHDDGVHAVDNVGGTTADFVVFERLDTPLPTPAQPVDASEAHVPTGGKELYADEDYSVVLVELEPGQAQEPHPGQWRAIYSLTDYTIEWREDDSVSEKSWVAGDAHWHEPAPHAARNIGDSPARWLVVGFRN